MKRLPRILITVVLLLAVVLGPLTLVFLRLTDEPPEVVTVEEIEKEQGVAVTLVRPVRMDFVEYLACDGVVDTSARVVLRAKIGETVEAVHAEVGDSVRKGQLLVEFRKTDLEAQISALRAAYEEARNNCERYQRLYDKGVVSWDHVEARRTALEAASAALQQAESSLKFSDVRAPIGDEEGQDTGRVQVEMRDVEPGEFKAVGKQLLVLVDLSKIEVRARVPEAALAMSREGQQVEFRLEGEEAWRSGTVGRIRPSTQDPNRFFDVFLKTENERIGSRWLMRPGMYAEVRIPRARAPGAIGVPASAVKRAGQQRYVFVAESGMETVEIVPEAPAETAGKGLMPRVRRLMAMLRSARGGSPSQEHGSEREPLAETKQVEVWRARRVEVQTGLRAEGYVQLVRPAIEEHVLIVASPRDDLRDGARLRIVESQ